ncbi:MAG: sigma-54 dependent transcriptional regulator [Phycisphaerae bacterium]|nr:sigma-54 dependent transcriptional regulator [Phycisphaerae bacterium]
MDIKETSILIVDDERHHADGLVEAVEKNCAHAIAVYNAKNAFEILENERIDIVVTDLKLDGPQDGLAVLGQAKKRNPQCAVILITAYASIENCKDAIKRGAFDYLVKPIDIDQLRTVIVQAASKINYAKPRVEADEEFFFEGVRGENPKTTHIFDVLRRVSPTNISVLIEGSSGTGKELIARAIHNNSHRSHKAFKPLNCAGLTESLLESELFGHTKGSFTGATGDRKGLFEEADGGTLFLDEIGDMPLNMQAKLLRVLEDGLVTPVGSNKSVLVDVRVISATNHDLLELIEKNKFRQDLYFRIKGVSIMLAPLKERAEDIPELISYFLDESTRETGSDVMGITEPALMILMNYDWPGNIRQLRNAIRTMVVMCDRDILDVRDIPPDIHQLRQITGTSEKVTGDLAGISLNELEKQAIVDTLAKTGGNREAAAKTLGIGERTLYRKIKEYNL